MMYLLKKFKSSTGTSGHGKQWYQNAMHIIESRTPAVQLPVYRSLQQNFRSWRKLPIFLRLTALPKTKFIAKYEQVELMI